MYLFKSKKRMSPNLQFSGIYFLFVCVINSQPADCSVFVWDAKVHVKDDEEEEQGGAHYSVTSEQQKSPVGLEGGFRLYIDYSFRWSTVLRFLNCFNPKITNNLLHLMWLQEFLKLSILSFDFPRITYLFFCIQPQHALFPELFEIPFQLPCLRV